MSTNGLQPPPQRAPEAGQPPVASQNPQQDAILYQRLHQLASQHGASQQPPIPSGPPPAQVSQAPAPAQPAGLTPQQVIMQQLMQQHNAIAQSVGQTQQSSNVTQAASMTPQQIQQLQYQQQLMRMQMMQQMGQSLSQGNQQQLQYQAQQQRAIPNPMPGMQTVGLQLHFLDAILTLSSDESSRIRHPPKDYVPAAKTIRHIACL